MIGHILNYDLCDVLVPMDKFTDNDFDDDVKYYNNTYVIGHVQDNDFGDVLDNVSGNDFVYVIGHVLDNDLGDVFKFG